MNNKTLTALVATTAITVGLSAGTFAWFTGSAASEVNTFTVGTLNISKTQDTWTNYEGMNVAMENMQCGDKKIYKFEVTNKDAEHGVSTLSLIYNSTIEDLTDDEKEKFDLRDVARFDLKIEGANAVNEITDLTYDGLKAKLGEERPLTARKVGDVYIEVKDTYTIVLKLPENLKDEKNNDVDDNNYQGKSGLFKIYVNAKQATNVAKQ